MKISREIKDVVALSLIVISVIAVIAVLIYLSVSVKGVRVDSGNCYSPEPDVEICHLIWLKTLSVISIQRDGLPEDRYIIGSWGGNVTVHGYKITAMPSLIFVDKVEDVNSTSYLPGP